MPRLVREQNGNHLEERGLLEGQQILVLMDPGDIKFKPHTPTETLFSRSNSHGSWIKPLPTSALARFDPEVRRIVWFGTEPLPTTGLGAQLRDALDLAGIPYWVVRP